MKELNRFRQFLTEEDFKNPILDKYLELKKSIDNKTVFDYELSDFINDLDNTERKGLESDLGLERDELYENQIMGYAVLINGKFYNNKAYKSESVANGQLTTLLGDVKSELGLEGGRKDQYYFGTKKGDKDLEQRLKDLEQAKVVAVTYK